MMRRAAPFLFVLGLAAACAEASGEVVRAENDSVPVDTSPVEYLGCDPTEQIDAGSGSTWADLYRDLFSDKAPGGCGRTECHGSPQGAGFLGTATRETGPVECFDETACRENFKKLVKTSSPERSELVMVMRHCDDDRNRVGFMPRSPASYYFSRDSMARVKQWIADGAN